MQSMGMSFFVVCPWPRPGLQGLNITLKMPYSLRTRNVIIDVAPPDPVPASGRGGHTKERHLHTPMKVSFLNNPEAKHQGQLPKCYKNLISRVSLVQRGTGQSVSSGFL
jgi:hypothetical protein